MFALVDGLQTTIFVTVACNTTCFIEIEFACVWPIEFWQGVVEASGKLLRSRRRYKRALKDANNCFTIIKGIKVPLSIM